MSTASAEEPPDEPASSSAIADSEAVRRALLLAPGSEAPVEAYDPVSSSAEAVPSVLPRGRAAAAPPEADEDEITVSVPIARVSGRVWTSTTRCGEEDAGKEGVWKLGSGFISSLSFF
jgi:hypothetical protein